MTYPQWWRGWTTLFTGVRFTRSVTAPHTLIRRSVMWRCSWTACLPMSHSKQGWSRRELSTCWVTQTVKCSVPSRSITTSSKWMEGTVGLSRNDSLRDAIPAEKVGLVTPRAFSWYDPSKDPQLKYFQEILQNSLSDVETGLFCEDFLRLLD